MTAAPREDDAHPDRLRRLEQELGRLAERDQDLTLLGLVAELAETSAELRHSEERYRTLFDHVPDGVLLLNRDDLGSYGRIEDANHAAALMHGYTLEELRGMDIMALNAPGQGARLETFDAQVWALTPGALAQGELVHRRKDGSAFPVESRCFRVELHGREYTLVFSRDLTERKRAEQTLLLTQRVESLGVLAGGIAHDFNNLLTAIMGQTGIAMDLMEDSAPARDHLGKALDAAGRAAALTRQMLAYAGRVQFLVQPVALNALVRENLRFLQAAIPKQVQFDLDLEEGLPAVTADPAELQQVIMNLVLNGVEAIGHEPGRITVRSRALRLEAADGAQWPLLGNPLPAGDYVGLEVADTGCGMAPEVLAKVFDPFFSTKPKGHGLGLAAVQGILRGHRGGLGVDSAPGQGTAFRILLPAGAQALPLPEPPARPVQGARRRVLVIDDEDYMREVIHDHLEAYGHDSLLARSGEEGLALFGDRGDGIDLVLLDLNMPGLGGAGTFARLRDLSPSVPVILSSGIAADEALAQLGSLEPSGFLQKPYRARDLVRMLEALAP